MGRKGLSFLAAALIFAATTPDTGTAAAPAEPGDWPHYAGGDARQFFNPDETLLNPDTVRRLRVKWKHQAGAIITSSPSVATVDLDEDGPTQLVYFTSWDSVVHALRLADGAEVWSFQADIHPAAVFPAASSPDISWVDGTPRVHVGVGEAMYALDAATGEEVWRFYAGTGCRDGSGRQPGLCSYGDGEQNQIESTALVADGKVFFGMDVDDDPVGKGGWYALDVRTGTMAWFLDLQSATVCRPDPADAVRRFDGFHSEAALGLPAGFLASRDGCSFPREKTGCESVWSSAAWDAVRATMYFATSNCDLDDPDSTLFGQATMPPHDEALVAVGADGVPLWRWRPREVDNDDLAFGAVPNLFSVSRGGREIDVVGVGNKDGTYTVVDRDGVNEETAASWTDPDAATTLPYWRTRVVPGGNFGGVIATAAVDESRRRVVFSTAAGDGDEVFSPQQPTVHALDLDTGASVWANVDPPGLTFDSSYGPTSAVPGVAFVGSTMTANLRAYATDTGELLFQRIVGDGLISAIASGAAVVDGTVVVGTGVGARHGDRFDIADITSRFRSSLVALCVTGVPDCPPVAPGPAAGVTAVPGPVEGTIAVSWTLPPDDGGRPLTRQVVRASGNGGSLTLGPTESSATFTGLVPAKPYTFTVQADNSIGPGAVSAPSAPAVPHGPAPRCGGQAATVIGSPSAERIDATPGPDVIAALGGSDVVLGLGGDDVVCGGDGGDILVGGPGNDTLYGEAGNDWLLGDSGVDTADGGIGFDLAFLTESRTAVP